MKTIAGALPAWTMTPEPSAADSAP
jgi:hypothetical protein